MPLHISTDGSYSFNIVGESYHQPELRRICGRKTPEGYRKQVVATLTLEDDNPHDDRAVRVDIEGKTVGHLSREGARSIRQQLRNDGRAEKQLTTDAIIVGGWDRGGGDEGDFGVKLDLG